MNEQPKPDKFRAYRARKRAAGLREVRMWVPDLRSPIWQERLASEAAAIRTSDDTDAHAWLEHSEIEMASWTDWVADDDAAG